MWQINSSNWSSCSGGSAPCTVAKNLACAKKVHAWGGNTWKFWSTCSACGCCSRKEEEDLIEYELNHPEEFFVDNETEDLQEDDEYDENCYHEFLE